MLNFNHTLMDVHNHTIWSDGVDSMEDIVLNAIHKGLDCIGISDHFDTLKCHSVSPNELDKYISLIESLKKKYSKHITICSGVEISFDNSLCKLDSLPFDLLNKLDYVIFEYFNFNNKEEFIALRHNFTCNVGLAHTDLINMIKIWNLPKLFEFLKNNKIFWEININEGHQYFFNILEKITSFKVSYFFKNMKKFGIPITVGSDIHSLKYFNKENLYLANKFAKYELNQSFRYDFSYSRLTSNYKL